MFVMKADDEELKNDIYNILQVSTDYSLKRLEEQSEIMEPNTLNGIKARILKIRNLKFVKVEE